MIHDTESAQISQNQDGSNIYAIMKTVRPPGYHHNGFVATHALGHMMYGYYDVMMFASCRFFQLTSTGYTLNSLKLVCFIT